jgi:hypothetical protein
LFDLGQVERNEGHQEGRWKLHNKEQDSPSRARKYVATQATNQPDNDRENRKLEHDYPAIAMILCVTEPFRNCSRYNESR